MVPAHHALLPKSEEDGQTKGQHCCQHLHECCECLADCQTVVAALESPVYLGFSDLLPLVSSYGIGPLQDPHTGLSGHIPGNRLVRKGEVGIECPPCQSVRQI